MDPIDIFSYTATTVILIGCVLTYLRIWRYKAVGFALMTAACLAHTNIHAHKHETAWSIVFAALTLLNAHFLGRVLAKRDAG